MRQRALFSFQNTEREREVERKRGSKEQKQVFLEGIKGKRERGKVPKRQEQEQGRE